MNTKFNTDDAFGRIAVCLDELAEAKGVGRCALMYALLQIIETLKQGIMNNEKLYEVKIAELQAKLDGKSGVASVNNIDNAIDLGTINFDSKE